MAKSKRYHVIAPYRSPYPEPIIFHRGELVALGDEFTDDPDWKDWVWCRGENDNQAWCPKQYLRIEGEHGEFLRDYNALELSVEMGEELIITETIGGFGMAEKPNGERGWVPLKKLEKGSSV